MDISLSEFQTRFEDVAAGERQEDVVVSVAGGVGMGKDMEGWGGEGQGVETVLLDTGAVASVLIGAYSV